MAQFTYESTDGTLVRGWRGDGVGAPVIISNGLGTPPEAWPAIISPDSGFRVATWYYRGTAGGARPLDRSRIAIEDHVEDLRSLMDHEGMDRAVIACWSVGVNVGFEFARRYPERCAGLLAVAGVPGGTFDAMFGPLPLPRLLRHPLGLAGARLLGRASPALGVVARSLPLPVSAEIIRRSAFMSARARREVLVPALAEFFTHDFRWYFTLAEAAAPHAAMELEWIECPVTLVAGRWDMITSFRAMVQAAHRIPHARLRIVSGTHFLPLERPAELCDLLYELAVEAGLAPAAAMPALTVTALPRRPTRLGEQPSTRRRRSRR